MIRVFGISITPFSSENDWDVWQGSRGGRGVVVSWGGGVIFQGTGSGLQGQRSKVQGPGELSVERWHDWQMVGRFFSSLFIFTFFVSSIVGHGYMEY